MSFNRAFLQISMIAGLAFPLLQVEAAPLCSAVHQTQKPLTQRNGPAGWKEVPQLQSFRKGLLNSEKLNRYGLVLNDKGELFKKSSDGKTEHLLGTIKVIETPLLFEWEDKDYHQTLIENRGIDSGWMDDILAADGQAAGKGFYVSTSPTDSEYYGSHLTVFRTKGPILLLEFDTADRRFFYDTGFVKRLSEAGIDGLRTQRYIETWMSLISNRHLQTHQQALSPLINHLTSQNPRFFVENPKVGRLLNQLSPEDLKLQNYPLAKLYTKDRMSLSELKQLIDSYQRWEGSEHESTEALRQLQTHLPGVQTPEELTELIAMAKKVSLSLSDDDLPRIQSQLKSKSRLSDKAKLYRALIELYDFKTLSQVAENRKTIEPLNFEKMKLAAAKYQREIENTNWTEIKTLKDFMAAGKRIYGLNLSVRSTPVVMVEDYKQKDQSLQVTNAALNALGRNKLLNVQVVAKKSTSDNYQWAHVEYWSPTSYYGQSLRFLSSDISQPLLALLRSKVDEMNPEYQALVTKALEQFVDQLLQHGSLPVLGDTGVVNKYLKFMSLHPFEDGNGRMGRLLYQILTAQESSRNSSSSLNLPIYDMDLFIPYQRLSDDIAGLLLKSWAQQAKDDSEFLIRCRWALEIYFRAFPEAREAFPEFKAIH